MTTMGWRTAGPFYVITASTQSQIERLIYWNCVLAESPCRSALVAQWIERLASNQKVGGSIPSEGTASICRLAPKHSWRLDARSDPFDRERAHSRAPHRHQCNVSRTATRVARHRRDVGDAGWRRSALARLGH